MTDKSPKNCLQEFTEKFIELMDSMGPIRIDNMIELPGPKITIHNNVKDEKSELPPLGKAGLVEMFSATPFGMTPLHGSSRVGKTLGEPIPPKEETWRDRPPLL